MSKKDVMSHGQANELVTKLEEAGLTGAMAQEVIESSNNQLARFWVKHLEELLGGFVSWGEVLNTFGRRAIPIEIAANLRLFTPNYEFYDRALIPRNYLGSMSRRGLLMVAMPAVSLASLQNAAPKYFYDLNWSGFKDDFFIRTLARPGYHLQYPAYPMSDHKTLNQQLVFIPKDMGVPFAIEVAYTAIAWRILTGEILLPNWIRCADAGRQSEDRVVIAQSKRGELLFGFSTAMTYTDEGIACGRYLNQPGGRDQSEPF